MDIGSTITGDLTGQISLTFREHATKTAKVGSRQRLRSATRGDLVVSSSDTHFGARAFAVAGGRGPKGMEPAAGASTVTGDSWPL